MALEWLGSQVGDAVALEVLCPGEGLPTALLWTSEAAVVVMLPRAQQDRVDGMEFHCSQIYFPSALKRRFTVCVAATWTCW